MARVRERDTGPERAVRKELTRLGIRYRLQVASLPGRPDIVIRRMRIVILVHGCFWHRHNGCPKTRMPKSRVSFWARKFAANVERDRVVQSQLKRAGWNTLVIWECETEKAAALNAKLRAFLGHCSCSQ